MNTSASTREGNTEIHGQNRERALRGHYWLNAPLMATETGINHDEHGLHRRKARQ